MRGCCEWNGNVNSVAFNNVRDKFDKFMIDQFVEGFHYPSSLLSMTFPLIVYAQKCSLSIALNLCYSYKYRSFDEYLIPSDIWENNRTDLLNRAGLSEFADFSKIKNRLEQTLNAQYKTTNENINDGKNNHARFDVHGDLIVSTPKVEKEPASESISDLFPKNRMVSLFEVLSRRRVT